MRIHRLLIALGLLLVTISIVVGVTAQEPPSDNPLGDPPTFLRGIYDAWAASPHADVEAEAFVHWNGEGEVPDRCAKCHSTPGYQDFLGADGSEAGKVDAPAALGSVINCDACHNDVSIHLTSVTFPSGVELTNLDDSARCMVCHQGRASTDSVNQTLTDAGITDMDVVSPDLSFINIHYYAAAASLYGSEVRGGYQYDGKSYQRRSDHVEGYNTCAECHNPHTLEVKVNECARCHEDVATVEDTRNIRMQGSQIDYDGDGDIKEGIAGEIATLQEMLYATIQKYAADVAGTPIVYDELSYPYFFIDTNANGTADPEELNGDNGYNAFTGNLVKATYNFQVSKKDPGNFAHNPKYHIELLYDSIEVLMGAMAEADGSALNRNDPGHFDSTAEAFRHWDEDGEVPGTCAKCHTAVGLPTFIHNGTNVAVEPTNSLACSTCHEFGAEISVRIAPEAVFPSGAKLSFGEDDPNNLCINCHQGRESTVSVDKAIAGAGVGDDEVSEALRFRNPHYFAAGATLFGGEAKGAYQYEGKEYNGRFEHENRFDTCNECHNEHSLQIRANLCTECHEDVKTQEDVRMIRNEAEDVEAVDYDGDGDTKEPVADEIGSLYDALLVSIQAYALETTGTAIAYNPAAYPYWFADADGNGTADEGEEQFATWTPTLLRAAYNYQYVTKDPGAFAHNADYILQVLYDSLEAIGGPDAVASFTRPPVIGAE